MGEEPLLSVVLATSSERKLRELRQLLVGLPVELLSIHDVMGEAYAAPIESGETFEQNARLKAREACRQTGLTAIADDSGLEVDALSGRPGVRSAVFAHERATDAENNAELLRALEDVPEGGRTARFRTVLALMSPWQDNPVFVEGASSGNIALTPRGELGFGYDPLLILDHPSGKAQSELTESERYEFGHRAQAARALVPHLLRSVESALRQSERIISGT